MKSRTVATFDPADFAHAVEDNLYDLFRAMAQGLSGGELDRRDELSRHHSFPFNPMFKGVWRSRLAPDRVDEAIDDTIAWFQARQAPFFFWWTGASTTPDDLGERLQARGQGIGGAITLKPLLEARDEGYRYGVLFSTEMGQSVYERIGFRATGTRINRYLWRNA